MNNKTNFFIKAATSIYDIKLFSKYAKEGIFRAVMYAMLLTLILSGVKCIFIQNYDYKVNSMIFSMFTNFEVDFINLLINCLIVTIVASIFTIIMKIIIKYISLYSLVLYTATLPLIIKTIFEVIFPNVSFDIMFIIGTLTYVVLTLKYVKDEIMGNFNSQNKNN